MGRKMRFPTDSSGGEGCGTARFTGLRQIRRAFSPFTVISPTRLKRQLGLHDGLPNSTAAIQPPNIRRDSSGTAPVCKGRHALLQRPLQPAIFVTADGRTPHHILSTSSNFNGCATGGLGSRGRTHTSNPKSVVRLRGYRPRRAAHPPPPHTAHTLITGPNPLRNSPAHRFLPSAQTHARSRLLTCCSAGESAL